MSNQNEETKPATEQEETKQETPALGNPPYTGGTDIHVGPGQETHLPSETTHTVQK